MLAADKLLLQSQIKQNAVQLREKELKLHYENFNAVGTQAAVLAGFAMTALAEVTVPPSCGMLPESSPLREYTMDSPQCTSIWLKGAFYILVLICMAAQIHCVCNTTFITVWGALLLSSLPQLCTGAYPLLTCPFAHRRGAGAAWAGRLDGRGVRRYGR
jgi:hypothetical protein